MIYLILWILFLHLVADFVLQDRATARAKSYDTAVLTSHCVYYFMVLFVGTWIGLMFRDALALGQVDIRALRNASLAYAGINAGLHFATDAVSSRLSKMFWETAQEITTSRLESNSWMRTRDRFEWLAFLVIGADQYVHQFCLIFLATYL